MFRESVLGGGREGGRGGGEGRQQPGLPGPKGEPGQPGQHGQHGRKGDAGNKGDRGHDGRHGERGELVSGMYYAFTNIYVGTTETVFGICILFSANIEMTSRNFRVCLLLSCSSLKLIAQAAAGLLSVKAYKMKIYSNLLNYKK